VNLLCSTLLLVVSLAAAGDWPRFRGPNGSGVGDGAIPLGLGPAKHVIWKTPLPPGHSSPIVAGERVFVTAADQDALLTIALDRVVVVT
jgi:outer membrane protein assembly factor BamB